MPDRVPLMPGPLRVHRALFSSWFLWCTPKTGDVISFFMDSKNSQSELQALHSLSGYAGEARGPFAFLHRSFQEHVPSPTKNSSKS